MSQLVGHTASLFGLQVVGTTLCTASADATCRLWDMRAGRPVLRLMQGLCMVCFWDPLWSLCFRGLLLLTAEQCSIARRHGRQCAAAYGRGADRRGHGQVQRPCLPCSLHCIRALRSTIAAAFDASHHFFHIRSTPCRAQPCLSHSLRCSLCTRMAVGCESGAVALYDIRAQRVSTMMYVCLLV